MNREHMNMFPRPPQDSGRHAVQTYANISGGAEKAALFSGMAAADQPKGPCLVTFFVVEDGAAGSVFFHLETSTGAADASSDNGLRLNGYYNEGERTFLVNPRTTTHVDMVAAAGSNISWYICSPETESQSGG